MKNLSHFDEQSQSFRPSQVGRYEITMHNFLRLTAVRAEIVVFPGKYTPSGTDFEAFITNIIIKVPMLVSFDKLALLT